MKVERIRLRDFRGYQTLDLDLGEGTNLIYGRNASGKTNLLEAVYVLSLGRSFRTNEDSSLIRKGADVAYAEASIVEEGRARKVAIAFSRNGKKAMLDGKPISRLSELQSVLNCVLFVPSDASLFTGSPSRRRNFLDISISKQFPDYLRAMGRYERLLRDRNAILKSREMDSGALEAITARMVGEAHIIRNSRSGYVAALSRATDVIASALFQDGKKATIEYRPFLRDENFEERAIAYYRQTLEGDRLKGSTQGGIHREDFSLLLNGRDVALYGSQGENRLCAIALKLAPYFLVKEPEKKPVALLDDVTSELDEVHLGRLYGVLGRLSQVLITATEEPKGLSATKTKIENHTAWRKH